MTHIEQMIQDMCPNGVEWKTLGEVCDVYTGGEPPIDCIKAKAPEGDYIYPIYSNGVGDNAIYGFAKTYTINERAVTFSSIGTIGHPTLREGKFTPIIRLKVIIPKDDSSLNISFVKYALDVAKFSNNKSSLPNINAQMLKQIEIPLPPLEIQKKIVECLDKFSALAAELQAELQKRRTQYEYYRTRLLTPPPTESNSADNSTDERISDSQGYTKGIARVYDWQWKTLGEVGEMIKGSGIQKSDFVDEGLPCIHYGQVHTYYGTFAYKTKSFVSEQLYAKSKKAHTGDLVIATTSEDVEACCKATAWLGDEDVAVSGDAHIFRHNQNPKYMAYLFQTEMFALQKRRCATGAKVTRVHGEDMLKFRFPFPPLEEQERVVNILDKFEVLLNSLSDGIPAEQAAQQKRYEYYRDLLLTFDRKAV